MTKEKIIFRYLMQFSSNVLLKFSPLGRDLPCKHSFFAQRPIQLCLYLCKYSTFIDAQKLFSGCYRGQGIQIGSQNSRKQHFHGENRGIELCLSRFLKKLRLRFYTFYTKNSILLKTYISIISQMFTY